jgi:transmembrane sensor
VLLVVRALSQRPLRLADQRDIPPVMVASASGALSLSLDDGSALLLRAGARLEVLESSASVISLAVRRGNVDFDVRPGGPRAWRVECGTVTVEVVGTHFAVERSDTSVRVTVDRGAVVLRGDGVPDHVLRLGVGRSITLQAGSVGVPRPATAPQISADGTVPFASEPIPFDSLPVEHIASEAGATPNPSPASAASKPTRALQGAADLFAMADVARRDGRFAEAANLLHRLLSEHGSDSRAPLAEFALGQMCLDSFSRPQEAVAHFTRALDRGLPMALAEDARARLVEAHARAGQARLAAEAAARYRSQDPNGTRTQYLDQWAPGP